MVLKLGMYVHLDNHSDEFENGADQIQNGRLSAILNYFSGCKRVLIRYVHLDNSSDEFETGADQIQNGRRSAIFVFLLWLWSYDIKSFLLLYMLKIGHQRWEAPSAQQH